jgi:ribosome-binding factor A
MTPDPMKPLAADSGPEDGTDPKEFHAKPWDAPKRAKRKAAQLCRQVTEALHDALAACADPTLQAASVLSVTPAPHTGRLCVVLGAPADVGAPAVRTAATRASGRLRGEVARAINRRYAPELTFEAVDV